MDDVKEGLFIGVFIPGLCIEDRGIWADKQVSQIGGIDRKCDAVGGTRIVEKLSMERANLFRRDEKDGELIARDF